MTPDNILSSFKAITYIYGVGDNKKIGTIVYIDLFKPDFKFLFGEFGHPIIFADISNQTMPQTGHQAKEIVLKILKQEHLEPQDRIIYNMITWRGNQNFDLGEYVLERFRLQGSFLENLRVEKQEDIEDVPLEISQIFHSLLGRGPYRNISRQGLVNIF